MQTTQHTPETPPAYEPRHIINLLKLHDIKTNHRSYITKAATVLPLLKSPFTVPALARKAGIPRSKGYPAIKQLETLRLVQKSPKLDRPRDWHEYTRSMRKRFNRQHGLPQRGIEPQRYIYTPEEAMLYLREKISMKIRREDQRALDKIKWIHEQYREIAIGLASHQR